MNRLISVACLASLSLVIASPSAHAEPPFEKVPAQAVPSQYVPDDGVAVITTSVSQWLDNSAMAMFPIEIVRVQAKEQFGVDPANVSLVKAVVGLGPTGPQFGIVVKHDGSADFNKVLVALDARGDKSVGPHKVFLIEGPPGTVI